MYAQSIRHYNYFSLNTLYEVFPEQFPFCLIKTILKFKTYKLVEYNQTIIKT